MAPPPLVRARRAVREVVGLRPIWCVCNLSIKKNEASVLNFVAKEFLD